MSLDAWEKLAAEALAEPDDERDCARCGRTMAAPEPDLEPSALCNLCAHAATVELATALREATAEFRILRAAPPADMDQVYAILDRCNIPRKLTASNGEATLGLLDRVKMLAERAADVEQRIGKSLQAAGRRLLQSKDHDERERSKWLLVVGGEVIAGQHRGAVEKR